MTPDAVLIRPATPADAPVVERLAQLDSSPVPAGRLLLAEVDGEVRAALSVDTMAAVADPFARTAPLVAVLAARAADVDGRDRRRTRRLAQRLHLAAA